MNERIQLARGLALSATLAVLIFLAAASVQMLRARAALAVDAAQSAEGQPVIETFTLKNSKGASAKIITYGATLSELWMPDRSGKMADVVLGFSDPKRYEGDHPHFGGTIGRYANRIAKGRFTLNGKQYQLAINNGPNTLHGGNVGFDRRFWKGEMLAASHGSAVRLTYHSPDGEENFPGNFDVAVVYTLTGDNALKLEYTSKTGQPTPINLTNHSYFNLSGGRGNVLNYILQLDASRYTPVDSTLIPTGEIASVKDTPYDFTKPTAIGARIAQLTEIGGYDINYVIDASPGKLHRVGRVEDPASGRVMELSTTEPGVQLYTGNGLDGSITGVGGIAYEKFGAICLETQHFPDSVNHPNFPNVILRPGQTYHQETIYKFSAK